MNQKLQNIFDIVQQSETLAAEQKEKLLKEPRRLKRQQQFCLRKLLKNLSRKEKL